MLPGWPHADSPFHPGEQTIQQCLGIREKMERAGRRVIRAVMPDQHRSFFPELPVLFLAARDRSDQPWASLLAGPPGFVTSPEPAQLRIAALPEPGDPVAEALFPGAEIGLLGLQFETRRRNRANGRIAELAAGGMTVAVRQSFGNCPKYIQARDCIWTGGDGELPAARASEAGEIGAVEQQLIAASDTFFIASAHRTDRGENGGLDVSHRGGRPGFIRIDGPKHLTIPDFAGNLYFNTLGNLVEEPRCGLLFTDFATGGRIQIAARGEILRDSPERTGFAGAERLLGFTIERVRTIAGGLPLSWCFREASPFLAATGVW